MSAALSAVGWFIVKIDKQTNALISASPLDTTRFRSMLSQGSAAFQHPEGEFMAVVGPVRRVIGGFTPEAEYPIVSSGAGRSSGVKRALYGDRQHGLIVQRLSGAPARLLVGFDVRIVQVERMFSELSSPEATGKPYKVTGPGKIVNYYCPSFPPRSSTRSGNTIRGYYDVQWGGTTGEDRADYGFGVSLSRELNYQSPGRGPGSNIKVEPTAFYFMPDLASRVRPDAPIDHLVEYFSNCGSDGRNSFFYCLFLPWVVTVYVPSAETPVQADVEAIIYVGLPNSEIAEVEFAGSRRTVDLVQLYGAPTGEAVIAGWPSVRKWPMRPQDAKNIRPSARPFAQESQRTSMSLRTLTPYQAAVIRATRYGGTLPPPPAYVAPELPAPRGDSSSRAARGRGRGRGGRGKGKGRAA